MGIGGTPVMLEIDYDKCTGCGDCVTKCPGQAVTMLDGKPMLSRPGDCTYCTDCEGFCPSHAIRAPYEIIMADPGYKTTFTSLLPVIALSATSLLAIFSS